MVGNSATSGETDCHAFLFGRNGMTDLGTLGGSFSIAFAINDEGQVVGESSTSGDNSTTHAFLYEGNGMHDLGTLGGSFSRALGINNAGQIVGVSPNYPGGRIRAFLYSDGVMTDLNSLSAVKVAGWFLDTANAINSAGQIIGSGVRGGQTHAYLLSPKYERGQHGGDQRHIP